MVIDLPGIDINYAMDVHCPVTNNKEPKLTIKARKPPIEKSEYSNKKFVSFGGKGDYFQPVKFISKRNI